MRRIATTKGGGRRPRHMAEIRESASDSRFSPRAGRVRQTLDRLIPWRRLPTGRSMDRRWRIALWAVALGFVAGAIELPLPAEDAFRAARAAIRMHAADQEILVVTVDDKSLNALGVNEPSRGDDARVLDRLFAMGAQRVFFDRVYADPTQLSEDLQFKAALERHRGRVFVGALPAIEQSDGSMVDLLPHPRFRSSVEIVSIEGEEAPFGLSARFPTNSVVLGAERPSLSAELARLKEGSGFYRPDFAIDYATIPTVSYIDVLNGAGVEPAVRGRDVVVAPSSRTASDFHPLPFRGKVPGVYFHVLGAETLKRGFPLDLGWLPALFAACILVAAQARLRQPSKRAILLGGATFLFAPLVLDEFSVSIDVMPALMCLTIASVRLDRLARRTYYGNTALRRIETLQLSKTVADMDVFALKIRNFAIISASLSSAEIDQLLEKSLEMLRATDPEAQFAFHKDTFVWTRPKLSAVDAENHIHGLHAMFRTSILVGSHAPDVATSLGVDANREASLRERTENATQCAEDAAHSGRIFQASEAHIPEDRNWRLQILSELESAIESGEVDVAFQPKVSLSSLSIVGAEALLRWTHPTRGPIDPAHVIAIAEAHNRTDMITRFVLNRALSQALLAIARNPSFKIAINISSVDLHDPMFSLHLEQIIAAHRFPASSVVLEITETARITDEQTVAQTLATLKKMQVQLSVDDFGTGHATLEQLRRIPADEVKIDQSFVRGMETNAEDHTLVRTAIDMIHSLGRRAVAEGVERQATLAMLREMGCDEAQGYLFSKPITMQALLPQLSRGAAAA
jgi:diguanylate cyclase